MNPTLVSLTFAHFNFLPFSFTFSANKRSFTFFSYIPQRQYVTLFQPSKYAKSSKDSKPLQSSCKNINSCKTLTIFLHSSTKIFLFYFFLNRIQETRNRKNSKNSKKTNNNNNKFQRGSSERKTHTFLWLIKLSLLLYPQIFSTPLYFLGFLSKSTELCEDFLTLSNRSSCLDSYIGIRFPTDHFFALK